LAAALERKKRAHPPRERILDGEGEAQLVRLACSAPPEGQARWTLALLADSLVELQVVETSSRQTVMRTLKKRSASSGSTGGGIKMIRTLILARQSQRELSRLVHPTLAAPVTIGSSSIPNHAIVAILGFIFLYAMSIIGMTVLLIFGGLDFISAVSAVVACMNNMGPGPGQVGPATNCASLNGYEIWVLSFTMLLGRLEVLSLLVLFTPQFWRK
jgi:Trk-type K+ transport system membrane component